MSVKVPAGTVKANAVPCDVTWSAMGEASTGASLTLTTVSMKPPLTESLPLPLPLPCAVGRGDEQAERADVGVGRRAAEGARGGVEREPRRQRGARGARSGRGERGRVAQRVAGVDVGKGTGRHGEGECRALRRELVGDGRDEDGRVVDIGNGQHEVVEHRTSLPSVAVTRMATAPTSALAGVPEKVCVAASNVSQAGRPAPEASFAP